MEESKVSKLALSEVTCQDEHFHGGIITVSVNKLFLVTICLIQSTKVINSNQYVSATSRFSQL